VTPPASQALHRGANSERAQRWHLPARVAVLELIAGGGWSRIDQQFPPDASLLDEGCSMLDELIDELTEVEGTEVHTCLAIDLPMLDRLADAWARRPAVRLVRLTDRDDWLATWREIASQVDWCLVIAPELGGALERTLADLATCSPHLLNCRSKALRVGCDKWEWNRWLLEHDWSQPLSFRWPEVPSQPPAASHHGTSQKPPGKSEIGEQEWVVKPPDGAGGFGLKRFRGWPEALEYAARCRYELSTNTSSKSPPLIQAWIRGEAGSVVGFFDPVGTGQTIWLCPVRQRFEELSSGGLRYIGGEGPWRGPFETGLLRFQQALSRTPPPGLCGWCGFDFVVPDEAPDQIIPIELNPRLTSSFGLYRQIYGPRFLAQLLNFSGEPTPTTQLVTTAIPNSLSPRPATVTCAQSVRRLKRLAGTAHSWCWQVDTSPIRWPAVD